MAAISYSILVGGNLQTVVAGANAPAAGTVEIRMDQTTTAITDGSLPSGSRAAKKGEIYALIKVLEEYLIQDSTVAQ
jgi:hypothetical protein